MIFIVDDKPYWFDVEKLLSDFGTLATKAFESLKSAGTKWINERAAEGEDAVLKFSKGKISMVTILVFQIHF
jgi:hypothetical protein